MAVTWRNLLAESWAVEALHAAACDGDADVRAYARHAIDGYAAKAWNFLTGTRCRSGARVAHAEEEGDIVIAGHAQDLTGRMVPTEDACRRQVGGSYRMDRRWSAYYCGRRFFASS